MNRGIFHKGSVRFLACTVLGATLATSAIAQSSSGNIVGEGVAGDTVVIQGPDNGFHREMELKEDGKYQIRRVPLGDYTVVVKHADGTFKTPQTITVKIGSTARAK